MRIARHWIGFCSGFAKASARRVRVVVNGLEGKAMLNKKLRIQPCPERNDERSD